MQTFLQIVTFVNSKCITWNLWNMRVNGLSPHNNPSQNFCAFQKGLSHSHQDSWRAECGCVWCWWESGSVYFPTDTQSTGTEPSKSAALDPWPHFHACSQCTWPLVPLHKWEDTEKQLALWRNRPLRVNIWCGICFPQKLLCCVFIVLSLEAF